jgi:hypothetical protein
MIKIQPRTEPQPRRHPLPDMGGIWGADDTVEKGRKHEAFDTGFYSGDRRGLARVMRFDRKR